MKPTINGFSITKLNTCPTEDGYAINCNLLRNGKKYGTYYHRGDGGIGSLYCTERLKSDISLNKELSSWKKDTLFIDGNTKFDYEWSLDRLVEELVNLEETAKTFTKAIKKGFKSVFVIEDDKHCPKVYGCAHSDRETINTIATVEADKQGYTDNLKIEIYVDESDFRKEVEIE